MTDNGSNGRRPRARGVVAAIALTVLAGCSAGGSSGGSSPTSEGAPDVGQTSTTAAPATTSTIPTPVTTETVTAPSFSVGLPEGWEEGEVNEISDLFLRHATKADVELGVRSSPIAGGSAAMEEYVTSQRETLQGYSNTDDVTQAEPLDIELDGEEAQALDWTFTAELSDGERASVHQRRIFVVHAGTLYDVTFQSPTAEFPSTVPDLDVILRSWSFD